MHRFLRVSKKRSGSLIVSADQSVNVFGDEAVFVKGWESDKQNASHWLCGKC